MQLLTEICLPCSHLVQLFWDNKSGIIISHDPFLHDHTKHAEVDHHFIKENLETIDFYPPYIPSAQQRVDVFTKGLPSTCFLELCGKLGMDDIHSPAWGDVLLGTTVYLSPFFLAIYSLALTGPCITLRSLQPRTEIVFLYFPLLLFFSVPIFHWSVFFNKKKWWLLSQCFMFWLIPNDFIAFWEDDKILSFIGVSFP